MNGRRAVTVTRAGPLTVVADLGRPGWAHLGVPHCGALDPAALRLANRLVGNPEGDAGLEVLLGGLELRAESPVTVAVTGAPVTVWRHGDGGAVGTGGPGPGEPRPGRADEPRPGRTLGSQRAVGSHRAVPLRAGERLELGTPEGGLRCYVTFSGGLDLPVVLGGRGSDLLSGLGPAAVADGDRLPLGVPGRPPAVAEPVPVSVPPPSLRVPVLLGPRDDWFADPATVLAASVWTVGPASNRIGLRLSGEPLARVPARRGEELPSEPVRPGAVQVPPSGQPVIFLADAPTTGGYPVVAVVADAASLGALAQARPGGQVRLVPRR